MYFPYSFFISQPVTSLTDQLLAFYTFNNCSDLGEDSLGNFDVTAIGGTISCIAGKNGNAARTDTLGCYMAVNDTNGDFDLNSDKTITFWFRVADATCNTYLVGKEPLFPNWNYATLVSNNQVAFFLSNTDLTDFSVFSEELISSNTWYFVVAKHELNTKTFSIQVNNGTIFSNTYTGSTISTTTDSFRPVEFNNITTSCDPYSLDIDSVGVWNRLLTSEEISILYNNGNSTNLPF